MMKKRLCLLILCLPLIIMAQDSVTTGIKWTAGLSWEQVKQKAKNENKYIFIDAYATWCVPCKMMDKYVYLNDTVGKFFNERYIAVKVQMDKTEKDDKGIKDWYDDVAAIGKDYTVIAYPSLIFLSPEGKILQKEEGYRPVQQLVAIAKETLTPDKVYDDPYKEYKNLIYEYRQGIKHYDRMPYMIKTALKLNDSLTRELFKEHLEYASRLNETERYTKDNIEVWSSFILKLDSKALQFFLKDGNQIDHVMNQKGYSRDVIDNTIQARIVDSFFRMQKGKITIMGEKIPISEVMVKQYPMKSRGFEPDYIEADWNELRKMVRKSFNKDFSKRNVLIARFRWYMRHENIAAAMRMYFNRLDKYPPDDIAREIGLVNENSWKTFLFTNDKILLKKASFWMEKLIKRQPGRHELLDTYASLLYKMGQTDKAIQWEKKAISITTEEKGKAYQKIIKQMKNGEPIYLDQGAIWK